MVKKINVKSWVWPIPSGKSMSRAWSRKHNEDLIYYVVLREDFLKGRCQRCKNILNMEFGWKSNDHIPLFVCSNIRQLKPTIEHPVEWGSCLVKKSSCPFYKK